MLTKKNNLFYINIITTLLLIVSQLNAQTLEGTCGLFFIPTAEMQKDATITIGTNFVNKNLVSFSDYSQDAITPYITFSFLPFVEFNIKITRYVEKGVGDQALGDRTFSGRLRIIEESSTLPSIVIGCHDLLTVFGGVEAIHNNSLYIVATKNFQLYNFLISNISLTAGYGSDILQARTYNFVGLFGGVSIEFFRIMNLMNEYDGKRFNGGFRIKLFNNISILGGFLDYKHFSGGVAVSFQL